MSDDTATTNTASMGVCVKGEDAACTDDSVYGAGSCCFWGKVTMVPTAPAEDASTEVKTAYATQQAAADDNNSKKAWKVKMDAEGFWCVSAADLTALAPVDNMFTEPTSGIKYEGYCAGAVAKAAMTIAATATLIASTAF